MIKNYQENGYLLKHQFFTDDDLATIEPILRAFHAKWCTENHDHYQHQAINSAYITHPGYVSATNRQALFNFIAQDKLAQIAQSIIPGEPAFMNTQLFFNPFNQAQQNYWHRDLQYLNVDIPAQQKLLHSSAVLHFRVPLADEPGIELVPGTHRRWDDAQEFETRMGKNGRVPSNDLPTGRAVALNRGDLLVFSANMIHRGLYGGDRFAFDIIYSDADPQLLRFVDAKCLPDDVEIAELKNSKVFAATKQAIQK